MNEKFIAYGILSAFAPVVVMAFLGIQSGEGFWKDYLDVAGMLAAFSAVLAALVWAVTVVLQ